MNNLSKVVIVVALLFLGVALFIKFTTVGRIIPGPLPFNWAKLADTFLLLAIAISLANKK